MGDEKSAFKRNGLHFLKADSPNSSVRKKNRGRKVVTIANDAAK
jgi:hypothetical protein